MDNAHRKNYWKGTAAGFVATLVLSALMFMKGRMDSCRSSILFR